MAPQAIKKVDSLSEACCEIGFLDELAKMMEKRGLEEVRLSVGSTKIELLRHGTRRSLGVGEMPSMVMASPALAATSAVAAPSIDAAAAETVNPATKSSEGILPSPMVGTVYLSPKPGEPAFVTVGSSVKAGQTLLIIEAMKVMNQIQAPKAGKVTAIMVEDGQPVEYGQPLLAIE